MGLLSGLREYRKLRRQRREQTRQRIIERLRGLVREADQRIALAEASMQMAETLGVHVTQSAIDALSAVRSERNELSFLLSKYEGNQDV